MALRKLLVDTNIIIDFLHHRDPYFKYARLLLLAGRVGEFSLWISSSQVTDLVYILTDGGNKNKMADTLEKLRSLRTFVNVLAVTDTDVDRMLATSWSDPEDALLVELALKIHADAIISRDNGFPDTDAIRVLDPESFFAWLREEESVDYDEVEW